MVGTSRRPHVVTPQRCDIGSTNLKVNKWQRRDASTSRRQREFYLLIIKSKRGAELEASGIVRARARKSKQSDIDLYEEPVIFIFPRFLGQ